MKMAFMMNVLSPPRPTNVTGVRRLSISAAAAIGAQAVGVRDFRRPASAGTEALAGHSF